MSRPDEGMIHAWLDGELDAAEAARIEALVRNDAEWAAAAAEARGFVAASARIVGALDHVPANVIPKPAAAESKPAGIASTRGNAQRAPRGAPWWAMRAAALLVIAVGTAVIVRRTPDGEQTMALQQTKTNVPTADAKSDVAPAAAQAKAEPAQAKAEPAQAKAEPAQARTEPTQAKPTPIQQPPKSSAELSADIRNRALADAPAKAGGGGAGAGISARADAKDERTAAARDSLGTANKVVAADKPLELKKELPFAASTLSEVVTTSVGGVRRVPGNIECYRESASSAGARPLIHRVTRLDDSTATPAPTAAATAAATAATTADSAARRVTGATGAVEVRARGPVTSIAKMKIRGDTLVLSEPGLPTRVAVKTACTP